MKIEAYAKVNLVLEVFARRDDGFHALRSVVVPVSLSDTLDIVEDEAISSDSPFADDLCVKAARELAAATGTQKGARISVIKRIPAGGGLGGGSADAAAVLRALNNLWRLDLTREQLAQIGARVGSDVPALALGGAVLMEGRGEKVSKIGHIAPLNLVLATPNVFSSTKEVYSLYDNSFIAPIAQRENFCYHMCTALKRGNFEEVASCVVNDLASPARELHPEIAKAAAALQSAGAVGVTVSGSGSTVFGLVPSEAQGRQIAALLSAKGLAAWSVYAPVP